jgi:LPXTG-site transpeptidase (sortase) family protein
VVSDLSDLKQSIGVVVVAVIGFVFVLGQVGLERAGASWPHLEPLSRSAPSRLIIPAIGVSAPVITVGVQRNGQMAVPELADADRAAWFRHGPVPGEPGTAVIVGHVDSQDGPAVFYRLKELRKGNLITVTRRDGELVRFKVSSVVTVSKAKFPAEKVYDLTDRIELRLISCGGPFDRATQSYQDNVIVYAKLV